jgi:hypothetical protein
MSLLAVSELQYHHANRWMRFFAVVNAAHVTQPAPAGCNTHPQPFHVESFPVESASFGAISLFQ